MTPVEIELGLGHGAPYMHFPQLEYLVWSPHIYILGMKSGVDVSCETLEVGCGVDVSCETLEVDV